MREVMEYYGLTLLGIAEVTGSFLIVSDMLSVNGMIYSLIEIFFWYICG